MGRSLELIVKTLPGDHVRPLQQDLAGSGISPDLLRLAEQATQQAVSQARSGRVRKSSRMLRAYAVHRMAAGYPLLQRSGGSRRPGAPMPSP